MRMLPGIFETPTWIPIRDGNPLAREIYSRHYSCRQYRDGRAPIKVMGPGYYELYVLAPNYDALIGWLLNSRPRADGQSGVNCTIFRNESPILSSVLLLNAEARLRKRWPYHRLFTYIDASKVRGPNPGYCFKVAGWKHCGFSKRGLHILEKGWM